MKTNKYKNLLNFGISQRTLMSLSEAEINALHSSIIGEASTKDTRIRQTTYSPSEVSTMKSRNQGVNVSNGEVSVKNDGSLTVSQRLESEMKEGKKRKGGKQSKNPWAICTAEMGKEFGTSERSDWTPAQSKKYERCVRGVKKSVKEGLDPMDFIIESRILSLIDRRTEKSSNSISKRELLSLIERKMRYNEANEPAEPKTKPKVDPGKTEPKKRPSPFRDPDRKDKPKPAPKAKYKDMKENMFNEPAEPKTKPKVDPGKTEPKKRPSPFRDPDRKDKPKPAPKAKHKEMKENMSTSRAKTRGGMPSWFSFNSIKNAR